MSLCASVCVYVRTMIQTSTGSSSKLAIDEISKLAAARESIITTAAYKICGYDGNGRRDTHFSPPDTIELPVILHFFAHPAPLNRLTIRVCIQVTQHFRPA